MSDYLTTWLIGEADEEELKNDPQPLVIDNLKLVAAERITHLATIERLTAALEFYANEKMHDRDKAAASPVEVDGGKIARAALQEPRNDTNMPIIDWPPQEPRT